MQSPLPPRASIAASNYLATIGRTGAYELVEIGDGQQVEATLIQGIGSDDCLRINLFICHDREPYSTHSRDEMPQHCCTAWRANRPLGGLPKSVGPSTILSSRREARQFETRKPGGILGGYQCEA